jgi:uncharacterized repeat protein (TIGR03803 family)
MANSRSGLTQRQMAATYAVLSVLGVMIGAAVGARAQTETVLHSFSGGKGGSAPSGGLVFDTAGNLYGTTLGGGNLQSCSNRGCGTVFQLSPVPQGSWTYTALHSFSGASDGAYPDSLVLDGAGNVYGTAFGGGQSGGGGTAFELTPAGGAWTESELWAFAGNINNADVSAPIGMIFDSGGNLYGTGQYGAGGIQGPGGIFELSPAGNGVWNETLLYRFTGGADGGRSLAGPIFDSAGNLYGTTYYGGKLALCQRNGCGVVFELSPSGHGWKYTVLYAFHGNSDGSNPAARLTIDPAGNLYGLTENGGNLNFCGGHGCGTVFRLKHTPLGWKKTILHSFVGGLDGAAPLDNTGMALDSAGNLYGTTSQGGGFNNCVFATSCGTVFKLSHTMAGWKETVLHAFTGGVDGEYPTGGIILDAAGNAYGVTEGGGSYGKGVAFRITPQ